MESESLQCILYGDIYIDVVIAMHLSGDIYTDIAIIAMQWYRNIYTDVVIIAMQLFGEWSLQCNYMEIFTLI